ncbi:uncharacterized protein LOC124886659 [Capsicum annuum]|uniref:uncharacterized protein LOC124886659 n=1 Tax=Capsicum annuum TaxID=4072 RepID=UPI001FB0DD3D|nr:uncharacterized protein LOC124886659 [Capsicum annuum]
MGKFLTGVSSYMVKECRSAMLNIEMNLSRLMTHAQQIKPDKIKERDRVRGNKRARSEQPTYGQNRSQGVNCPQFQSRSSMPAPSSASAPALRGRQAQTASAPAPVARPAPTHGFSSSTAGGQCLNRFYVLASRQEQEDSPDVVTGLLCVFQFDVYTLLDPGSSFSYVTPWVAVNFES